MCNFVADDELLLWMLYRRINVRAQGADGVKRNHMGQLTEYVL